MEFWIARLTFREPWGLFRSKYSRIFARSDAALSVYRTLIGRDVSKAPKSALPVQTHHAVPAQTRSRLRRVPLRRAPKWVHRLPSLRTWSMPMRLAPRPRVFELWQWLAREAL